MKLANVKEGDRLVMRTELDESIVAYVGYDARTRKAEVRNHRGRSIDVAPAALHPLDPNEERLALKYLAGYDQGEADCAHDSGVMTHLSHQDPDAWRQASEAYRFGYNDGWQATGGDYWKDPG